MSRKMLSLHGKGGNIQLVKEELLKYSVNKYLQKEQSLQCTD